MTKSTTVIMSLLLGVSGLQAQQLANSGLDNWEDCTPWNSKNTTTKQGTTPTGWCVSNVVTPGMNMGNATVANNIDGKDNRAVYLFNKKTAGQVIPGYMVLGKTWATAKVKGTSPMTGTTDGGCWGGKEFTYTPDAIAFDYIRTQGSGSTQPATINAYLWKGSTSQKDVPACNTFNLLSAPADPDIVTMENRDRTILKMSMENSLGGAVTYSEDFALIATLEHKITEANTEWKTIELPFEYASDETPSMINLIFSAGDYFADRSAHMENDALSVDNVRMIYHSRLSDLKVNGESLPEFASDKYEYESPLVYDNSFAVVPTVVGRTAEAETKWDDAACTLTVKVTGADADSDGAKEHSYVVKFAEPEIVKIPVTVNTATYSGKLTIDLGGSPEEAPTIYFVNITAKGEGKCDFALNHFSLTGNEDMGDIVVNDVETYKTSKESTDVNFAGSSDNIVLHSNDLGTINATATIEGVLDAEGNLDMQIHVIWKSDDLGDVPIEVTFNGAYDANATTITPSLSTKEDVRYYNINGMEVNRPESRGIYIVKKNGKTSKMIVK